MVVRIINSYLQIRHFLSVFLCHSLFNWNYRYFSWALSKTSNLVLIVKRKEKWYLHILYPFVSCDGIVFNRCVLCSVQAIHFWELLLETLNIAEYISGSIVPMLCQSCVSFLSYHPFHPFQGFVLLSKSFLSALVSYERKAPSLKSYINHKKKILLSILNKSFLPFACYASNDFI